MDQSSKPEQKQRLNFSQNILNILWGLGVFLISSNISTQNIKEFLSRLFQNNFILILFTLKHVQNLIPDRYSAVWCYVEQSADALCSEPCGDECWLWGYGGGYRKLFTVHPTLWGIQSTALQIWTTGHSFLSIGPFFDSVVTAITSLFNTKCATKLKTRILIKGFWAR